LTVLTEGDYGFGFVLTPPSFGMLSIGGKGLLFCDVHPLRRLRQQHRCVGLHRRQRRRLGDRHRP
jgi:hypothetical protein